MKYIVKQPAPPSLVEWTAANRSLPNFCYTALPAIVKDDLWATLLKDQYYLCAYTGLRAERSTSHIEHMLPQSVCLREGMPGSTVDYRNMVACVPGDGDPNPGYGAREKDAWPELAEQIDFLKPTDPSCETRIRYNRDGTIKPASDSDRAATTTIAKLNLGHDTLRILRRDSIGELFMGVRGRSLTRSDLVKRYRELQNPRDGRLEEFFIAKKQCLEKKIESWN
jgi:uncharacterized protein (TIGR02646 family)